MACKCHLETDAALHSRPSASIGAPLLEGLEQLFGHAFWETATLILDLDEDATRGNACCERHVTVGPRELEGVLQQVRKRRAKHLPVGFDN